MSAGVPAQRRKRAGVRPQARLAVGRGRPAGASPGSAGWRRGRSVRWARMATVSRTDEAIGAIVRVNIAAHAREESVRCAVSRRDFGARARAAQGDFEPGSKPGSRWFQAGFKPVSSRVRAGFEPGSSGVQAGFKRRRGASGATARDAMRGAPAYVVPRRGCIPAACPKAGRARRLAEEAACARSPEPYGSHRVLAWRFLGFLRVLVMMMAGRWGRARLVFGVAGRVGGRFRQRRGVVGHGVGESRSMRRTGAARRVRLPL
ncbi:Uncharacterised protein [Burkholderia pseudomallei]|nr:Uncharacterised protein [Burkholderia pseudomallei]CAJ4549975.1 Uncharacterised protein [Burkholderia pseudomallei]CAJ7005219.1 Uncharacterised protein [Burkholderia pseudomallei]CAJ9911066.1 Uncharacterised protein [Burkholderia pseudomallei]CAJ9980893.1 Uncharacterised protein [Burkholderia pseudomallei]